MHQDIPAFTWARRVFGMVHTMYSEVIFDPDASEERKAEATALRSAMPRDYNAGDSTGCNEARMRILADAGVFFGDPSINIP